MRNSIHTSTDRKIGLYVEDATETRHATYVSTVPVSIHE